ncbi:MAG: helix-hairpin-helix domain-containing protein [Gemmatimonadetes bacterium]|nr:helix-hairpin-helix domain-containing protein [Gemmatimonadota bacterium]MCY3944263.1 helix-hairpin-helix domain-containing protein [Gemmatimonadota bacterium]
MTERERTSMLSAGVILGAAALIRFVVLAPGEGAELLAERGSIADSLLAAGDSAAAEGERRSRPLGEGEQIDPNTASAEELDRLPGVGPATAERIVRERTEGGPFATVADLTRVSGIGPRSAERLRPHLRLTNVARPRSASGAGLRTAGVRSGTAQQLSAPATPPTSPAAVLDLNRATVEELLALPGVGPVIAERIVALRTSRGRFADVAELEEVPGVGSKSLERIAPLVRVR